MAEFTIERATLAEACEQAALKAHTRVSSRAERVVHQLQRLRSTVADADRVALGAYCVGDCGCPMVQAGLAQRDGVWKHDGISGGDIDDALRAGGFTALPPNTRRVFEVVD